MKFKWNYVVIPLSVLAISVAGSAVTGDNMIWYKTLNLPNIAPPGAVIGAVWTVIFILAAISILLFWNKEKNKKVKKELIELFLLNGFLNILWSIVFFGLHLIGWSIVEMLALNISNLFLIVWLWQRNHKTASILLWPYFAWVSFATYLAYTIWTLNR